MPVPAKYAAYRLGLCEPDVRGPLAPISDAARKRVDAALQETELLAD